MTYQVKVKGVVVYETDTAYEATQYADEYHNDEQGYTISSK